MSAVSKRTNVAGWPPSEAIANWEIITELVFFRNTCCKTVEIEHERLRRVPRADSAHSKGFRVFRVLAASIVRSGSLAPADRPSRNRPAPADRPSRNRPASATDLPLQPTAPAPACLPALFSTGTSRAHDRSLHCGAFSPLYEIVEFLWLNFGEGNAILASSIGSPATRKRQKGFIRSQQYPLSREKEGDYVGRERQKRDRAFAQGTFA